MEREVLIMGYVEQRLMSGEQVVVKAGGHWFPLAGFLIIAALLACMLPLALVGIGLLFDEGIFPPFLEKIQSIIQLGCCSFGLIGIVVIVVASLADYLNMEFALTTDNRIIAKRGTIKRQLLELDQSEVKSVEFWQPPLGKFLDCGRVTLTTDKAGTVVFHNLAHFGRIRMQIEDQLPDKLK
jgi:hypothetical protein